MVSLYWCGLGPPTKLIECLAADLPLLARDILTHTDCVRYGINGLIFKYNAQRFAKEALNNQRIE